MPNEVIRKPVAAWNRDIRVDWSKLFSVLGKTGLKGASLKFDEAWEEVIGGVEALGLKDKPDGATLAWLLINVSLSKAVLGLLIEARKRHRDLAFSVHGDGAAAIGAAALMQQKIQVERGFLNRPETLPFLGEVKAFVADWLAGLGLPEMEARTLAGRLDGALIDRLRLEWRGNPERWRAIEQWHETPFDEAAERQECWDRTVSFAKAQPEQAVFGEAFSLRDVYVPLRAYTVERRITRRGREGHELETQTATLGWLDVQILDWVRAKDVSRPALRVISGGPGSGKSSSARILAAKLADEDAVRVLYVPLHRFRRLDGVFKTSLAEYCETWVTGHKFDPVDALPPGATLVLFLDGLDELTSSEDKAAADLASEFARELRFFLEDSHAKSKDVRAIVGGRELAVQSTADARFRDAPVLHVFPYAADNALENKYAWTHGDEEETLFSLDQRDAWWERYAFLTGLGSPEVPTAIKENRRLQTLTEQPLLNYLVASFARRHGQSIDDTTSEADVYDALIRDVYDREWRQDEDAPRARDLAPAIRSQDDFFAVLEEVALAVWHRGGRGATLATIEAYLDQSDLIDLIAEIRDKLSDGIANLLLTFFFRQERAVSGAAFFEFTHKSFQEYLTARRILRSAQDLGKSRGRERDIRASLARWVEIAGPAFLTDEIIGFMRAEVRRNASEADRQELRQSLALQFSYQLAEGLPVEDAKGPAGIENHPDVERRPTRFGEMRRWSDNAEFALLVAIGTHAPDRSSSTKPGYTTVPLAVPDDGAFRAMIQRAQALELANGGDDATSSAVRQLAGLAPMVAPWHQAGTMSTDEQTGRNTSITLSLANLFDADLCNSRLDGADLSLADLGISDLSAAVLRNANLSFANLRDATLRDADLEGAFLNEADLRRADLSGANLSQTNLFGAHLRGADLGGAENLADAVFSPGVREELGLPPAAPDNPELDLEDNDEAP